VNCYDSVIFVNCYDSVIFVNCHDSVIFVNCYDSVIFVNCYDSVIFVNCYDSVIFGSFSFYILSKRMLSKWKINNFRWILLWHLHPHFSILILYKIKWYCAFHSHDAFKNIQFNELFNSFHALYNILYTDIWSNT